MTSKIVPFVFKQGESQTPIRTLRRDDDPWFVAVDVCRALGLDNATRALERLDADEKGLSIIQTLGGPQELNIISEPGLYKLIQGSRKPAAKTFDRFVRHEILPAYRRGELTSAVFEPDLLVAINRVDARLGRVDARLERIEGRFDDRRQGFSKDTVRYVCEGIAKYNNRECIYCNDNSVVTKYGEQLDTGEQHHVDGNRANKSPENLTIPCIECHKRLTNKKHSEHIPVHLALGIAATFHRKLKQKTGQIRPPGSARFWDFRVATQVEMDFPQAAKRNAQQNR